ncbi:hypothetical protein [Streptomyces sp. AN091965]|uniref:hypothetical protein n=1 Tax=Streptomyces sp. AN091965 TaxID=2927803 RepID=UPI001F625EE0|nr:hypothetical protein [Streptomyces sp. AN091965]MCI3935107.1 hypothetical protein [Streptomyces sp. AN091965]
MPRLSGPDSPPATYRLEGAQAGPTGTAFCRAHGPGAGAEVIDAVPARLQALLDLMREQAALGNEAFQQHIAEGHTDLYEADIRYVRAHRDLLRAAFDDR